jgi:hypothetical protein
MHMVSHQEQAWTLANHNLLDPLGFYVVYAPIRDLPATFLYYHPVTLLGWKAERDIILSPVVILESIIFHIHSPVTSRKPRHNDRA